MQLCTPLFTLGRRKTLVGLVLVDIKVEGVSEELLKLGHEVAFFLSNNILILIIVSSELPIQSRIEVWRKCQCIHSVKKISLQKQKTNRAWQLAWTTYRSSVIE